jgi:hypothetical protein
VAQIPSGEIIESPIALIRASRAGAPANHIFAPHPNERSKAFLGPPLLTPHQAQLHACRGLATGGKDLLLLTVSSLASESCSWCELFLAWPSFRFADDPGVIA